MREKSSQSMNTTFRKSHLRGGETRVMKKTLSSILVFALVLTMLVPAFSFAAGETTLDKFNALKAAGILSGVNEAGDAGLDRELTREELAKVLVLLAGLTATPGNGGFADVPADHWAATQGWIVPVKEAGLMEGVGNGNFGLGNKLTFAEIAKVVVTALGLEVDTTVTMEGVQDWAAPYVKVALESGILAQQADYHAKATRGDLVDSTYVVFESQQVKEQAVTASAVTAKAIKVVFNAAVSDTSAVTFSTKRDGVNVTFAKTEWNDAKTEATLSVSYKLFAGNYTLTAKVGDNEYVAPTFKVEDEKVANITFLSDVAVINDTPAAPATEVTTAIKVENQYGEDITSAQTETEINIISSKTHATTKPDLTNGVITITSPAGQTFAVDEKLTVTLVKGDVIVSKTLVVAAAADIASVELGEVTTNETVKTIYEGTDLANKAYWLPLTVKDQYGNVIKNVTTLQNNLTVITSDSNIINVSGSSITTLPGKSDPVLRLAFNATNKAGIATITVVSKTGKSASAVVEVKANAKVDTFTVYAPETIVKAGVPFVLPFTAFDQYGAELSKSTDTGLGLINGSGTASLTLGQTGSVTSINVTNGTVAYKIDYINGNKVVLEVTPSASSAGQNVVIVVTTPTAKVQTLTLAVQAGPVAKTISGLKSTFYTAIQAGMTQTKGAATDVVSLRDQYGDTIGLTAGYSLTISAVSENGVTFTAPATFAAGSTAGSSQYKVTLKDNTGKTLDEYVFTVESVALKDITQFSIKDTGKFYTGSTNFFAGNASSDYDKQLTFEGKKADGTKVLVNSQLLKGATITAPLTITEGANGAGVTAHVYNTNNQYSTAGADKTATITFTIEGANGPIAVTKELVYSDAKPVAQSLIVEKVSNGAEITDPVIEENIANFANGNVLGEDTTFAFVAEDQYGVVAKLVKYTVTNVVNANNDATVPSVSIANDGTITSSGLQAGDSFVITATIDGLVKSLKVILK